MRVVAEDGTTSRHYVDGGFVQVADNVVSVLTNQAIPSDELDEDAAAEQLKTAQGTSAHGDESMALRDRVIAQARGRLRVARRSK